MSIQKLKEYLTINNFYVGTTINNEYIHPVDAILNDIIPIQHELAVDENFIVDIKPMPHGFYHNGEIHMKACEDIIKNIQKYLPIEIIPDNLHGEYKINKGPNHIIFVGKNTNNEFYAFATVYQLENITRHHLENITEY